MSLGNRLDKLEMKISGSKEIFVIMKYVGDSEESALERYFNENPEKRSIEPALKVFIGKYSQGAPL